MAVEILMPALSPTMEEGTLSKWLVKEGDTIVSGDILAEIETDKATMEIESVDEGVLSKILVAGGTDNVKVNQVIAILLEDGDDENAEPVKEAIVSQETVPENNIVEEEAENIESMTPVAIEIDVPAGTKMVPTTIRDALRDAMAEEMRRDDDVFLMGEEVAQYEGAYKVSREMLDEFGARRVIDTPITEHGFAGLGVGAAFAGLKPIIEFMTFNFAMQAIDHIINSAAKTRYMSGGQMSCPIVFRGPNGAASRVGAQHSQDYAPWYGHVPGLIVLAPYDAADAKGLLKAAIRDPNPVVFLEHELMYGEVSDVPEMDDWLVPIGKALVRREGTDATITAHSRMVGFSLQAAEILAKEGISVEVIDLRTIRPLDEETILASVRKTNRLVTVEESWGRMGVGAEVAAMVTEGAFDYLDAPPKRVHQVEAPLAYAANLEALAMPSPERIAQAVRDVCYV
ncbi:MAG: pyruvate dehydrogenase complex E1 component subunit beta [Robiginitomaculum sp.]|nr:pyruvate dehydrogenase complex E1 component subunit beta [Robiginitomaculum sp.]